MKKVEIIEVGPRDGLQNESRILDPSVRGQFVKKLAACGLKRIEAGAFVSPKWVPQMENSLSVAKKVQKLQSKTLRLSALVPNERGMIEFLKTDLREAALFTASSETFSKRNINCSIEESFERFAPVVELCKKNKIKIRAYLSTVFGCPFEGEVSPNKVYKYTKRLLELGAYEVSLGDTIGVASPKQIKEVFKLLLRKGVPASRLAGHYHDTRGAALANVLESINHGIYKFDSCLGGLGGCPYAPGASGNLATEDLVYMLERMGYSTGVNLKKLIGVSRWIQTQVGHPLMSHLSSADLPKGIKV